MENIIKEGRTRREFLKGAGAVVAGGVVVGVVGSQLSCEELPGVVGLKKAVGYVSSNPEYCASCSVCMAACTLFHEGDINIEVARLQAGAPPQKSFEVEISTCWQCEQPECIAICPNGAFHVDDDTGARVIDEDLCLGATCKLCMGACPQGIKTHLRYNAELDSVVACDLCGGDPLCVKMCPKSVDLTHISAYIVPEKDRVLKFVKSMDEGADESVRLLANDKAGYFWGFGDGRVGHYSP